MLTSSLSLSWVSTYPFIYWLTYYFHFHWATCSVFKLHYGLNYFKFPFLCSILRMSVIGKFFLKMNKSEFLFYLWIKTDKGKSFFIVWIWMCPGDLWVKSLAVSSWGFGNDWVLKTLTSRMDYSIKGVFIRIWWDLKDRVCLKKLGYCAFPLKNNLSLTLLTLFDPGHHENSFIAMCNTLHQHQSAVMETCYKGLRPLNTSTINTSFL